MTAMERNVSSSISIFAGQGTPAIYSSRTHSQALLDAATPAGSLLLRTCHETFHKELLCLPSRVQSSLKQLSFLTEESLLLPDPSPQHLCNAIVTFVHLFLVQALRFLATDDRKTNIFLPYSSGILPACVAASSDGHLSYLKNAVEALRLAFWIGARAEEWKTRFGDEKGPWSVLVIGMPRDVLEKRLHEFCQDGCSTHRLVMTSFLGPDRITVSGRPDILSSFASSLPGAVLVRQTCMNALYHSALLADVRDQVVQDVSQRGIIFPELSALRVPIAGLKSTGDLSLLDEVLDMILLRSVHWDAIVGEVAAFLCGAGSTNVELRNYGPGSSLANDALKTLGTFRIRLRDCSTSQEDFKETRKVAPQATQVPIAVVGMAVNLPGAPDTNTFWKVLEQGINTISEIPETRFKVCEYTADDSRLGRRMRTHTGNFIADPSAFDAAFFRVSPREAKSMDPQQRVLLHVAYHALENAGFVPDPDTEVEGGPKATGVWIGAATSDYVQNLRDEIDVYYSTGTIGAFLSGRISHALKLGGPSVTVNTACSSSLVAIYQACRALSNGDCRAALTGGVNIITSPDMFLGLDRGHFLSPSGQCKPFDICADGYSRGEGCGVFVLKRLADAMKDHDNILGVIRGVEVNQNGSAVSITRPHPPTQEALLRLLLKRAGVDALRVNVVEAHGTGTQAGDPSELESIRAVLAVGRAESNPLFVSSVKASIGHLEAASGAAGLAKLLLMLQRGSIVPQILFKTLNPQIAPLEKDHIVIATETTCWRRQLDGKPRFAVLNNFGAAGSNAALLLEEWVPSTHGEMRGEETVMPCVFGLSAKTPEALIQLKSKYLEWLRDPLNDYIHLHDLAYTMTARRQIHPYRLAVAAACRKELIEKLTTAEMTRCIDVGDPVHKHVIFMFSGQGAQYLGMGASLYRSSAVFKKHIDECHGILVSDGFGGIHAIIDADSNIDGHWPLGESETFQVAAVALQYALAKLWMSWGIMPAVVVGHSLGEYAALVISGMISLSDALKLVAFRARFMAKYCSARPSGMISVTLQSSSVEAILHSSGAFSELCIACYNTATDCVVSGPLDQLMAFKTHLDEKLACRNVLLPVPFGFHSSAMQPVLDQLTRVARRVTIRPPFIPICSTVSGSLIMPGDDSVFTCDHFVRHCTQPVLFTQSVKCLLSHPTFSRLTAWIEIAPHPTLISMLRKNEDLQGTLLLPSLCKKQEAWMTLASSLSQLFQSPTALSWSAVFSHLPSVCCVETPLYPFAETRFWTEYRETTGRPVVTVLTPSDLHPGSNSYSMIHSCVQTPSSLNGNVAIYETPMDVFHSAISGHKISGVPLCPVSVYLDQVLSGIQLTRHYLGLDFDPNDVTLKDIQFVKALYYDFEPEFCMETVVSLDASGSGLFSVRSRMCAAGGVEHVRGEFTSQVTPSSTTWSSLSTDDLIARTNEILRPSDGEIPQRFSSRTIYELIFPRVVEYSKEYHTMRSLTLGPTTMDGVAVVKLPEDRRRGHFVVHPLFLDAFLQVSGFIANLQGDKDDAYICSEIGSVKIAVEEIKSDETYMLYCHSTWAANDNGLVAEVYVTRSGQQQTIVAHLKNVVFRRTRLDSFKRTLTQVVDDCPFTEAKSSRQVRGSYFHDNYDCINKEVLRLVAETCHIPATSLSPQTSLQDLGIDSLMSIELAQHLRSSFPCACSDSRSLLFCPTISDIARLISEYSPSTSGPSTPITLVSNRDESMVDCDSIVLCKSNIAIMPLDSHVDVALEDDGASSTTSSPDAAQHFELDSRPRWIQHFPHEQGSLLFLFHDGSGLVDYYERLLTLDRPVWVMPNPRFMDQEPWGSIVQMAADYSRHVKAIAQQRRVLLGGWSFGGVVASECGRQLLASGYPVEGIILIDSPCPVQHVPLSDSLIAVALDTKLHKTNTVFRETVASQMRTSSHLLAQYSHCSHVGPYPTVALLRSKEPFQALGVGAIPCWLTASDADGLAAAWEALVGRSVKVWQIPGNHFQVFDSCNIRELSGRIRDACQYLEQN